MTLLEEPDPSVPRHPFTTYKLLSFDVYGTLVDWESVTSAHLEPLRSLLSQSHPLKSDKAKFFHTWDDVEDELKQSNPKLLYGQLLAESFTLFARRNLSLDSAKLSDDDLARKAKSFGDSVDAWPAFPDTVPALRELHSLGYKLVPVSNITKAMFAKTSKHALESFPFDAVFTAEEIGSYKPDLNNFHYLFDQAKSMFGVTKDEILHVAHGLTADHEPSKKVGLQSVWIVRAGSAVDTEEEAVEGIREGRWAFGWRANTLGELVDGIKKERNVG